MRECEHPKAFTMGLRNSQWVWSLPLLSALSLFLYNHRRMAITGDDVSLDQIVPVSRDFTLEEGATGGWVGPQVISALAGVGHWEQGQCCGTQCSIAKAFSFPFPQCSQMVNCTFLVSGPFSLGPSRGRGYRLCGEK